MECDDIVQPLLPTAGSTTDGKNTTLPYLRRMIFYADAMTSNNGAASESDEGAFKMEIDAGSESGNGEELISILARKLLLASDPSNLISSLPVPLAFLPKGRSEENDDDDAMEEDEEDDNENENENDENDETGKEYPPYYKFNRRRFKGGKPRAPTRIDALRSLLRALAPVAMDVAARASCHVLMSNRPGSDNDYDSVKGEDNTADTSMVDDSGAMNNAATSAERERLQIFVLLGFWTPMAPQLSPIVVDLFGEFGRIARESSEHRGEEVSSCPLTILPFVAKKLHGNIVVHQGEHGESNQLEAQEAVVASEASRELLEFYFFKRCEVEFVKKWWDWGTSLFILIHAACPTDENECNAADVSDDDDDDAILDSSDENLDQQTTNVVQHEMEDVSYYIGGYSPETNAPHCKNWRDPKFQMKWHASRAVGALFSLRPLPLSNFLKRLSVFESDVPFMSHPWDVHEEDAKWECNAIKGVARVVLPELGKVKIGFGYRENEALPLLPVVEDDINEKKGNKVETNDDENSCDEYTFPVPTNDGIRDKIPVHPSLVHVGKGLLIPRRGSVASYDRWCRLSLLQRDSQIGISNFSNSYIPTETTTRNMSLLGVAMSCDPHPPPILICGPLGSGKSSLVRELARLCSSFESSIEFLDNKTSKARDRHGHLDELLELHVDEETDSKTLLGSYVATDIPGEFVWMPGPLTAAARVGRWVLIEDVEKCPEEIQAALLRLLEERILPLGVGKEEKCHPGFRLFGTCVTSAGVLRSSGANSHSARRKSVASVGAGGKRVLHPHLWRKVHVDPLPFSELREVGRRLHPSIPHSISDAALDVLRKLDGSGRGEVFATRTAENQTNNASDSNQKSTTAEVRDILGHGARHASVREYSKLLSRIAAALDFEPGSDYATESQRLICLAETVDVFAMSCPCFQRRRNFICEVAAPIWGLTADAATRYVEDRVPKVLFDHNNRQVEVGRARLTILKKEDDGVDDVFTPGKRKNFADTNHALRFMEAIAVCTSQNEPTLLVGETGCGKTTLVQRLASLTGRSLLVQNLSLQTDSTDLLGGYKPLEMRHVARGVYDKFVDLFVSSFSRSQNAQFLKFVLGAYEKCEWKKLAQCFLKAASMGESKMRELSKKGKDPINTNAWADFRLTAERFERQRVASESGLAFLFTEGALVDAIRTGKWVLLDEINLASSETLERLCGLLDDSQGSITLTEKGDAEAVCRHPDFRLFAAMNPATDAGKKDLPSSIRSRFTEIYVDELVDPVQLRSVSARYLDGVIATSGVPLEHSESVMSSVDLYLRCRLLSEQMLVDGGGQKPRYTTRTLCRALIAGRNLIVQQRFAPQRAILEGFELAFEGSLDLPSRKIIRRELNSLLSNGISLKERDHPARRPDGKKGIDSFVLIKPFWIKTGQGDPIDWSDPSSSADGRPKFILTPSATANLRRLCQAVASGPWSILLEGPTSAGKTTLVEYLAARCGHRCVRINNHEHTDIQEYTGSYAADSKGKISFQEGILVQALRKGHWVILDELNLAPSEVLEALNRLLDDNRELYIPEINETVKPHTNFRLFATQNPAGAYGGRKPLSRAFRNRFVEIHVADIPEDEMIIILERRCGCPPSHAKLLVKVMKSLRQRRSRTGIFRGKDGLITPRDLLRWANRAAESKLDLAREGYMLLAERLRIDEEKRVVQNAIEKELRVRIEVDEAYYGENSEGRIMLNEALQQKSYLEESGLDINSIAPTRSILRLLSLVMRCIKQEEPVLLVGDTGCGKTTVVQLMNAILKRKLVVVNCHASTETSDLLGGFRPIRGRPLILQEMIDTVRALIVGWTDSSFDVHESAPFYLFQSKRHDEADGGPYRSIPEDAPKQIFNFIRDLKNKYHDHKKSESLTSADDDMCDKKRRKLSNGKAKPGKQNICGSNSGLEENIETTYLHIERLFHKYSSLFEWVDGPLVSSMKNGSILLLDEMSLAEDSVLERLNSVLEPSRTIVLAEKGGEGPSCAHDSDISCKVKAHKDFRIFATMNPGGDFGKRELSPALRSRFTEIWVPAVSHRHDIDLVLERSLSSCIEREMIRDKCIMNGMEYIRKMILDYIDWFNNSICDDPNSFWNDFKLSLRDVLSWTRFIADTHLKAKSTDQWSAYVHGASLMHLDGLGLGTGVSSEDALTTRDKAKDYLIGQIPPEGTSKIIGFQDELKGIKDSFIATEKYFGVNPFVIPTGSAKIPDDSRFNFMAPTTGMNLRRVLRALQISKPILLEGSPGVGKTSLISALALASGHNLVRINLSEQTDISDLMGSDLPYSSDSESNGSSSASFRWCDGVLLKAIKQGHWVLLDELNLASQSVLEGLNSCLDHRASVYIPELGQTFACPPSFRIFAAQNPLAQGGGRKGLPKSFLNRFTKVFVEALTNEDLRNIVIEQFPSVPSPIVEKMISFNAQVQHDIDTRSYGQHGSPWEFNLRDIFRWCQLLTSSGLDITLQNAAKYADVLYTQRLRTASDRTMIQKRFISNFGRNLVFKPHTRIEIAPKGVIVGSTLIDRCIDTTQWADIQIQDAEPSISLSLLQPMEAVACCIRMNWACLLVGPSSSGKSTLLKTLADACNVHIETLAMSSSTDVTELIGCFEQTDSMSGAKDILKVLSHIHNRACITCRIDADLLRSINRHYWNVQEKLSQIDCGKTPLISSPALFSSINKLIDCFVSIGKRYPSFSLKFSDGLSICQQWLLSYQKKLSSNKGKGPFQWVDGILVQAMERGYWLHLENVNFCPSSVLDRLNPLMEFGGELVLTECGIADDNDGGKPRIIKPHPNFRLFLSMNPNSHGEVSRAMRNRCIEVCLLPFAVGSIQRDSTPLDKGRGVEKIDELTGMWGCDVRSHTSGHTMISIHNLDCKQCIDYHEDPPAIKTLKDWGTLFTSLLRRGMSMPSLIVSHQLLYEIHENEPHQHEIISKCSYKVSSDGLIHGISTRRDLQFDTYPSTVVRESRLLRIMSTHAKDYLIPESMRYFESLCDAPPSFLSDKVDQMEPIHACMRFQNVCRFVESTPIAASKHLASFLDGFCPKTSSQIKVALTLLRDIFLNNPPTRAGRFETWNNFFKFLLESKELQQNEILTSKRFQIVRFPHLLDECVTYQQLHNSRVPSSCSGLSVIAASFLMNEKQTEFATVRCPVTPQLLPLFQSADDFFRMCMRYNLTDHQAEALQFAFLCRDRFWEHLKRSQYNGTRSPTQIRFDLTSFLTQYVWFKKAVSKFIALLNHSVYDIENKILNLSDNLGLLLETIDEAIRVAMGGAILSSDTLWKRGGHPLLPSSAADFRELIKLNNIASSCALVNEDNFGFAKLVSPQGASPINIDGLISTKHPCLFAPPQFLLELLGALAMTFWASTDEMRTKSTSDYKLSIAPEVLSKRFCDSRNEFINAVNYATIDTSIQTIDNAHDLDDIKNMLGQHSFGEEKSDNLIQNFLCTFGEVQTSQIGEIWCVRTEEAIVCRLAQHMQRRKCSNTINLLKDLRNFTSSLSSFIFMAINHTHWSTADLRPYQTLLWTLESQSASDDEIDLLLKRVMPRMMHNLFSHHWCNSYNDLDAISSQLFGPSFWNKDDHEQMNESLPQESNIRRMILPFCAGPTRQNFNIVKAAMFRLLRLTTSRANSDFFTMESGEARRSQARKLLSLFARCRSVEDDLPQSVLVEYMLENTFCAFREEFQDASFGSNLLSSTNSDYESLLQNCHQKSLRDHFDKLLKPLVETLRMANNTNESALHKKRLIGKAWIYIGLLRLHLLIPSSPIDPGKKPAAKVNQLNWLLKSIRSNLLSYRLHFGLSCGDFSPDSPMTRQLLLQSKHTSMKRDNQEKKIIERPTNSPHFSELFSEVHQFCKTTASVTNVLSLLASIENNSSEFNFRSQEVNWQCSASSFCCRLSTCYSMYEDITIPIANEIRSIQRGLRELALANNTQSKKYIEIVIAQDKLLEFPFKHNVFLHPIVKDCSFRNIMQDLMLQFDANKACVVERNTDLCYQSYLLASLVRLQIQLQLHRKSKFSKKVLNKINSLFLELLNSSGIDSRWDSRTVPQGGPDNKETDHDEKVFQEFFPNHGAEFERLATSNDDDDLQDCLGIDSTSNTVDEENKETSILTESDLVLVVRLHEEIFSDSGKNIDDHTRIRAFILSYEAACQMGQLTELMESDKDYECMVGSHLMAMALRCCPHRSLWSKDVSIGAASDFHSMPLPAESMKADWPLRRLLIRVSQLLRAFPGHSILLALGRVIERIRQLDVQAAPIGKIMSGLEIILRKAQDWEQHASKHVVLGKPLQEVRSLVASWRKLELQSWSKILESRENKRALRALRYWPRLYCLIHNVESSEHDNLPDTKRYVKFNSAPSWLWKGFPNISERQAVDGDTKSIDDLVKLLDTFILTSDISEFWSRLNLIKNLLNESKVECETIGLGKVALIRMLDSFWNYYSRFAPLISNTKARLREPIEKRLKDEVKLAKWDEQSYYALAESSEKNHRKLMKFLRDYDEALDTTVLSILEQSFAEGVRTCQQLKAEDSDPVTAIPGNSSLFPDIGQSENDCKDSMPSIKPNLQIYTPKFGHLSIDHWVRANFEDDVDKYVLGIQRYAKKMASITSYDFSWASHGASCSAEISSAIFSRINVLREMKSTKQVKQRALVDLFKCLKEQGYSCMKWSVPSSIREPHHLMQLPVPSTKHLSDKNSAIVNALEKGESYFHRCQVEITRLRFEIAMLGSQYMSQREMALMQGYSEHIFFVVCQQRSMIAGMIHSIGSIELCIESYEDVDGIIPMGQASLREVVTNFEDSILSLVETLHQLVLLINETSHLITIDKDRATVRDIIARVKNCIFDLERRYSPSSRKLPITSCKLNTIDNMGSILHVVKTELLSCVKACHNILPTSIFDISLEHLEGARRVASVISERSNEPDISGSCNGLFKNTIRQISRLVQNTLISAQSIFSEKQKENDESSDSASSNTYTCHMKMIQEWSNLQLEELQLNLDALSDALIQLHEDGTTCSDYERSLCTMAAVNSFSLVLQILQTSKSRLEDASSFYHQQSKMLYILLRVFRVLISKGFCSDNVSDGEGEGGGGTGEMKFEDDIEGTGMGEGDGKQDVTDQIENEEQLLGVKGDEPETSQSSQDRKDLEKEEADTGMEMEADFQGDTYDLPEQNEEEKNNDNQNEDEEELEREMGDGNDPNEQVVDEKMWDNEEDDLNDTQEEEKFEDNSKISGEQIQDELRTKDQSDEDERKENDGSEMHPPNQQQEEGKDEAQEPNEDDGNPDLDRINNDNDDKYEDKHGVEVRNEENDTEQNDNDELEIDFNDNVNLGEDENNETDANDAEEESSCRDEYGSNAGFESDRGEADSTENDGGMADEDEENKLTNDEESCDHIETVGHGGGGADVNDDENSGTEEEEEEKEDDGDDGESQKFDPPSKSRYDANEETIGVAAEDGQDAVDENKKEIHEEDTDGKIDDNSKGANEHVGQSFHGSGGSGNDGDWQQGEGEEKNSKNQNEAMEVPNPFRSPGDAEKFWHKKLDIIQDDHAEESTSPSNSGQGEHEGDEDNAGLFEYTKEDEENTGQVLGVADEDQAKHLEENNDDGFEVNNSGDEDNDMRNDEDVAKQKQDPSLLSRTSKPRERETDQENDKDNEVIGSEISEPDIMQDEDEFENISKTNLEGHRFPSTTTAFSDGAKTILDSPEKNVDDTNDEDVIEVDDFNGISEEDIHNARKYWQAIQSETNNLSRRLCEKLRLVMEPLVATKLRGDYRTGKRVNMKRIIGYIASGYRKDKIWLRRTKPAKRDYRVLIAVDDSESMQKSQAGDMALRALATLANGMSQLEIGQLGVASFGEDMRLLHPFNLPFTSESGVSVVSNFKFDDKRTRTALCVESSINVLEGVESVSSSMQLVFMISDGRIERDSRSKLRRLIREMSEKNMLMVMIIVEGEKKVTTSNGNDSILSMKEVSFINGKPHIKHFIEDYPFPYYLVVGDLAALPEILGDALRQWFEMLAQIQNGA